MNALDVRSPADVVLLVETTLTPTSDQVAIYRNWLSADEIARADRLISADVSRRFVVARGVLRCLLGYQLGLLPSEVRFTTGPHGKPQTMGVEFNVSHSEDFALLGVSAKRTLGVDVESRRHRLRRDELAERFFSTAEHRVYAALPESLKFPAFYRIWTCKEAYIKAIGTGLAFPLGKFTVSAHPEEPPGLLHVADQPQELSRWAFLLPDVGPAFAAAIAVEGHGWTLERRQWDHGVATGSK